MNRKTDSSNRQMVGMADGTDCDYIVIWYTVTAPASGVPHSSGVQTDSGDNYVLAVTGDKVSERREYEGISEVEKA